MSEHADPDWFPPLEHALREPPGLLAAGGDLSPARLLAAYERGVFPWYSAQQPILWWSPDPRMVLFPEEFKCSRSLRKTLRNGPYTTRVDHAFGATIRGCAAPRRAGPDTWLNEDMIASYERLHELGFGHSIETYEADRLAGGLYGIQLGQVFFGESMFSLQAGRLQGGAGAPGRGVPRTRHPAHRLPGGQFAPGFAWALARSRAASLQLCCAVMRGASPAAAGRAAAA